MRKKWSIARSSQKRALRKAKRKKKEKIRGSKKKKILKYIHEALSGLTGKRLKNT